MKRFNPCPRSSRVALLAVVILGFVGETSSVPASTSPTTLSSRGFWTWRELGIAQTVFEPRRFPASWTFRYRLPPGVRQGPARWYVMRLHLIISLARDPESGTAYVSGSTNGRAAIQIELTNRGRLVRWSTTDLVRGFRAGVVHARRLEITSSNYLQYRGVRGGWNTLALGVERLDGLRIARVRVLPDSGIQVTTDSYPRLRLAVGASSGGIEVGDTIRLPIRLHNVGDLPARRVRLWADSQSGGLEFKRAMHRLSLLHGGAQVEKTFEFVAALPGRHRVSVDAAADNANRPGLLLEIGVKSAGGTAFSARSLTGALGGAVLAIGGLALIVRARRKRSFDK